MDQSCSDFEFFDFNNASEEEIKEIQAILKGPGGNGCVELPWEIPLKENCLEAVSQNESSCKADSLTSKGDKVVASAVGQALQFTSPQNPPVARLPPPVEAFVAPPTTIGPYANTPYFVSRTIPFVRAYPHMGVPFFACPLPGAGETSSMPTPYGQFVPMVPATVGQEKLDGQAESSSVQKNRSDRQFNRRNNKKKLTNSDYSSFDAECVEEVTGEEQVVTVSPPVSSAISSDRPTSVPIVPLPVPPSTFGTLPLHGYPPGLHTLPYTQMSGPQAPSAAMYYVPVFNHPYGSYIPSPPSAPMVLPVNIRPDSESTEIGAEEAIKNAALTSVTNSPNVVQSNCEAASVQCTDTQGPDARRDLTAKNTPSDIEGVTDCNSTSEEPSNPSLDISKAEDHTEEDIKDATRCWADLFKKPCPEVNGFENLNNLGKEVTNGKLYSVPASDSVL